MEKEQELSYYLPFAADNLVKSVEFLESVFEPAGGYNKSDEGQRFLIFLYSEILKAAENFIGPVFSLKKGGTNYPLPSKWSSVIEYLKKNKFIDNIFFEPSCNDEPKIIRCSMSSNLNENLAALTDGLKPRISNFVHGASLNVDEAISKAIGEFLERFSLLIYREKDLLLASSDDLEKKRKFHLDIKNLAGFLNEQKIRNRRLYFDEKSNFLWAGGKSLFNNKSCLIPAQLIVWNYIYEHQNWAEPILRESNTNGAGGHYTLTKAILSGLYELIQRDSFFIYWLNKCGPPQIDLKTIDYEPLKKLLQECENLNLEVRFYNTTTDLGIPSCVSTIFDHTGVGPKVSLGAGCEMDWDKMLLSALIEATTVFRSLRGRSTDNKYLNLGNDYKPFQDASIGQFERLSLGGNEKMFCHFQFFLNNELQSLKEVRRRFPNFQSPEKELEYLIEKFKSFGNDYEIFYYQANHKILKDLGYFSVKVIVPALVPLYLKEILAPLGASRLKEVPTKLGFEPAKELNPWPHPFP